ncbi:MAG: hypothetical protein QM664_12225 [Flavihumibacter sp.]
MAHDHAHDWENPQEQDFKHNWVNSSTFLFYLQVFCILAFVLGGCYGLYTHRYKGHPKVNVPANTTFSPAYK